MVSLFFIENKMFNLVGRDIAIYAGVVFEPLTPYFSTFKMCELLPLGYLKKKKKLTPEK